MVEAQKRSLILSKSQMRTKVLLDIKRILNAWDRDLKHFRIKEPNEEDLKDIEFLEKDLI